MMSHCSFFVRICVRAFACVCVPVCYFLIVVHPQGFEPQVLRILDNVRPDRQTVMFSATFPRSIETLAKRALRNPLEIIIGGRSVASATITQFVEVREPAQKFPRLLELLGHWYSLGQNILIFVDKQEAVDSLFRQLIDAGYPCLALHGGMDQSDRDFTVADFKVGSPSQRAATDGRAHSESPAAITVQCAWRLQAL